MAVTPEPASPPKAASSKPVLPFTMKIRSVRRGPVALEVDAVVTDAEGKSVSSESVTMHPKANAAAVCAMLQNHVTVLAQSMHRRGVAIMAAASGEPEDDGDLVGQEFVGSVVT
jgi:hypothetical protein